ncbi:MAG: PD40 domain-containing protein [Anaerolineae bacterium]|nr:PD40 domain-containing protein [Anaerolineae bacterium]
MKPNITRLARCGGSIILAVALLALALSMVQGAGSLTRTTIGGGRFPKLNADGTKIIFDSGSDFLGEGITGSHVWLYDTNTMTLTRITTGGIGLGYGLSADGQTIAMSDCEIWLYDTTTIQGTHITTASAGNRCSYAPSINADGTRIAFVSDSDFLGQNIPEEQYEIWLYDTATMTVTRITTASDSNRDSGPHYDLFDLSLNGDGTKIAFASDSDFLGQNIPDDQVEIWLYDTATMTVTRITTASASGRDSFFPTLGFSGAKIAFLSYSDFLGQGIPEEQSELWLYDTATMTYTRVTTTPIGEQGSYHPSLSADETKLAFMSATDFLDQDELPLGWTEIWVYDIETKTMTRITVSEGSEGIRDSEAPSINADGSMIVFSSDADFLEQGIPENQYEVWLYHSLIDLALTKSVIPANPVAPGTPITYTIAFSNTGDSIATDVSIMDIVPITLTSINVTHQGATITDTGLRPGFSWNVEDLAPNQGGIITITGCISTSLTANTIFTNTATITSSTAESDVSNNQAQVRIEVELLPVLSISDTNTIEGNNGQTKAVFDVTLSLASTQTLTVSYTTADGVATIADNDYIPASGVISFAPGSSRETITVTVNGDTKIESDEAFYVNLTGIGGNTLADKQSLSANATIVDGQGLGIIINDDISTSPVPPANDHNDDNNKESTTSSGPIATFIPLPVSHLPETGLYDSPNMSFWVIVAALWLGTLTIWRIRNHFRK